MAFEAGGLPGVATSQRRMVLSNEAEARLRPSGDQATDRTELARPSRRAVSVSLAKSQSRIVLSNEPEARLTSVWRPGDG